MLLPSGLWLRLMWYPATSFSKETWCLQLQEGLPKSEAAVFSGQSITSQHIACGHVLDGSKSSFWQTSHCDLIYDTVYCGSWVPVLTQDAGSMFHTNFVHITLHKIHKAALWIVIFEKTSNATYIHRKSCMYRTLWFSDLCHFSAYRTPQFHRSENIRYFEIQRDYYASFHKNATYLTHKVIISLYSYIPHVWSNN